jgi:hypothetical protein
MSGSSTIPKADSTAAFLEEIIKKQAFESISHVDLRRLLTAAVRLYAQKVEAEGERPAPVDAAVTTPTEAVVLVTELLHAMDINLFDLAMWYRRPEARPGKEA